MKTVKYIFLAIGLALFSISFYNCGKDDDPKSKKEELTEYLVNKSTGWSLKSIVVPASSATTEDQWVDFKLIVSSSTMSTSGHASGANDVWPTGGWSMNENGSTITRSDGVVMSIITLTAISFSVSFTVPDGTEIGGRVASLDGDYIFNLH